MSPQFERIVVITIMTILVSLFSWIYLRDRQQRIGLWMLGWMSILIHFSALTLLEFKLIAVNPARFIAIATLELAGMSFLLSVSKACAAWSRRTVFLGLIGAPSILYTACLVFKIQNKQPYPVVLALILAAAVGLAVSYYGLRKPTLVVLLSAMVAPGVWVIFKSVDHPGYGLDYLLWGYFATTGLLYWQHFRRVSPGVIFTSCSFFAWGMVFPIAEYLRSLHVGPPGSSVLWDIPKYFVAFGMILTLFENQTENLQGEIVERRRAEDEARAANQAKSIFLATMSHEIRTPMNGIIGITDILLDMEPSAQQKTYLDMQREAEKHLLTIINDILDFSKLETAQFTLQTKPVELAALMRETLELIRSLAAEKGLTLTWEKDPALPAWQLGDPARLRQILLNLLGNAVKFTESGTISLSAGPAGEHIHFSVRDTGIGIPEERQHLLFQDFSQAHSSHRFGGTGLGLAICKKLVNAMGGEIGVESEAGQGSRFWFTVPLIPAEAPAAAHAESAADHPETRGVTVLVAEDVKVNQVIIERLLSRAGHHVTL